MAVQKETSIQIPESALTRGECIHLRHIKAEPWFGG